MDGKAFRDGDPLEKFDCPIRLRFHACFKKYIFCGAIVCGGSTAHLCQIELCNFQVRHIERAIIFQLKNVMMERMFAHFSVSDRFLRLRKKYKKYRRQKAINDRSIENIMRALLYVDVNELELSTVLKFFEHEEIYLKRKVELTLSKMHIYRNIDSLYQKFTLKLITDINSQILSKSKLEAENMIRSTLKEHIDSIVISKPKISMSELSIKDSTSIKSIFYNKMLDTSDKLRYHVCIKFSDGSLSEHFT